MKFKIESAANRKLRKSQTRIVQWKVWFAWRPVRLTTDTVVWLENVARRRHGIAQYWHFGPIQLLAMGFSYGPITHVLAQPGVLKDVDAAAQQPGLFNPIGASTNGQGFSAAQAGGSALQGGSASNLGNAGQGLSAYGSSNAGAAPQGGLNSPPAQLRP